MTFATRITKRTPVRTIEARELAPGATVVTRSGEVRIIEGVWRPDRRTVSLGINGTTARLPACAPVMAYVEA